MEVRPDIALPEDVDMAPPPPPPEEPDGLETMLAALEVDSGSGGRRTGRS